MGGVHNTRILRFLLILGTVILTIFIYASYSSNPSLQPPLMRTAASAPASSSGVLAEALSGLSPQQQPNRSDEANHSGGGGGVSASPTNQLGGTHPRNVKINKKPGLASNPSGVAYAKKSHHREPTIDVDAGGVGGASLTAEAFDAEDNNNINNNGGGTPLESDVLDEAAGFVNNANDILEEQFVQNVDNTLGNINNSVNSQMTPQQPPKQQSQSQADSSNNNNNNNNKVSDSDVLIPTSNLQKFIENADKILKNFTVNSPPSAPSLAGSQSAVGAPQPPVQSAGKEAAVPNSPSGADAPAVAGDDSPDDDDEALPPSVIMTIKHAPLPAGGPPAPPAVNSGKAKTPPLINATATNGAVDTSKGIQTQQIYESGHMDEEIDIDKICPNGGTDLKLLIIITSAQAHAEARLSIRQTWAHYGTRRDVAIAFILGRSTNETLNLALSQENFIYGDLIRGHFIDSYNNLTLKTVSTLEWVDRHCSHAKYVLKTDDDMFINVPKLLQFLDSHSKEKRVIYGRLAKKWKPIRNKKSKYYVSTGQFGAPVFPPFTTGPAYVMSSDVVHDLYIRSLHQVYLKLEDVFTTGIVAQQLGIKRVHVNEFLNRRIAFNPCNIRKTISVHMVKANEQFDLWKKLLDKTTKCK